VGVGGGGGGEGGGEKCVDWGKPRDANLNRRKYSRIIFAENKRQKP